MTFDWPDASLMDPDEFDRRGEARRMVPDRGIGFADIALGVCAGVLWAAVMTMITWGVMGS